MDAQEIVKGYASGVLECNGWLKHGDKCVFHSISMRLSRRALKRAKKKRPVKVAFFRFEEFKGLEAMYGAADGTRTRDPRRDRPVF